MDISIAFSKLLKFLNSSDRTPDVVGLTQLLILKYDNLEKGSSSNDETIVEDLHRLIPPTTS
jgi:hypothetical protein